MEITLQAHEQGYWLKLTKSEREETGYVMLDARYGQSEELRFQISINVEELKNALKAFN